MDFNKIKQAIAQAAARAGIAEYEIYYMQDRSVSAETLKHEISSLTGTISGGLCFRCNVNGKIGYASTELMDTDEMEALVGRAAANAGYLESEGEGIIFAGSEAYQTINAPEPVILDAAHIKQMALDIQEQMYAADSHVTEGSEAAVMSSEMTVRIANSHGLDLSNHVGRNLGYAMAVVNVDNEPASSFEMRLGSQKTDFDGMAEKAVKDALAKIGAGHVETGVYSVVFDKSTMAQLLAAFSSVFSAKNAMMGLSLLKGKEGEKIAADCVTISDDPFRKGYEFQTPFDAEGVATYRKNVVDKGVLKTLLYNLAVAQKMGVQTTGNASKHSYSASVDVSPYCFCIEGSNMTESELLAKAGQGIYVDELGGLHAGVNEQTGDFSVEASGFMIENGQKGRPVKTFTVAGNFFDLLKNIVAVSDEVKIQLGGFTTFGAPCVLVHSISVAG